MKILLVNLKDALYYVLCKIQLLPMSKLFLFFLLACLAQALSVVDQTAALPSISVRDYYNMLQSVATHDPLQLYSEEMATDSEGCGITRTEMSEGYVYAMVPGKEEALMKNLNQLQQDYYFHWMEQGSPQAEEKAISPLMMFGEHGKADSEQARKALEEKNKQERNRQVTDEETSTFSDIQRQNLNPVAIQKNRDPQPPLAELKLHTPSDDISTITDDATTQANSYHSPLFSSKANGFTDHLHQAQNKLKNAREESQAAVKHFDLIFNQWEIFKNLVTAKQQLTTHQQKLSQAYHAWVKTSTAFQQAEAALRAVLQKRDPSLTTLGPVATAHASEVHRTYQLYQHLLFQEQQALQQYHVAQQTAASYDVEEGNNYDLLLEEANHRVNQTATQLEKCAAEVRNIKFEKPNTPHTPTTPKITSFKQVDASLQQKRAVDTAAIGHHDQGTQISAEDLLAWERETLAQKQARWKPIFHRMVKQMRQDKENKKSAAADIARQLLDEMFLKEWAFDIAQEVLAEQRALAERQHAAVVKATTKNVLSDMVSRIVEADQQKRAVIHEEASNFLHSIGVKAKSFGPLLESLRIESSEKESSKNEDHSTLHTQRARERYRAEMNKFCTHQINLLQQEAMTLAAAKQPTPTWPDTIAPFVAETGNVLAQCYRRPYEWYNNTCQFIQDQRTVSAEAGRVTEKYFADQGRRICDVPTSEYALETAQVAQRLYAELVEKRHREQIAGAKEQPVPTPKNNPHKELGYFEQIPLSLKSSILTRGVQSFFSRKIVDATRESDQRAIDFFREINKSPRNLEFWLKSEEIEKKLLEERCVKRAEFLRQAASEQEGETQFQAWLKSWPQRLENERQQKIETHLKQEQQIKEEQRRLEQEELERKRQQAEDELLQQEQQQKKSKKKNVKKKT